MSPPFAPQTDLAQQEFTESMLDDNSTDITMEEALPHSPPPMLLSPKSPSHENNTSAEHDANEQMAEEKQTTQERQSETENVTMTEKMPAPTDMQTDNV